MTKNHDATTPESAEPTSGHLTVRPDDAGPVEVRFMFENQEKRTLGAGAASVLAHVAAIGLCVLIANLVPERVYETILPDRSDDIVWLAVPGPGGGGGGGNKAPEPPKKAEAPGEQKITVPAVKPPDPEPTQLPPPEEPPVIELNIPAQAMAAATTISPGAIESAQASADSRGSGTGSGVGPGQGSGLGPGSGGNFGGGVYQPGSGVSTPVVVREVKPQYTAEAMRARVQGTVWVQAIVRPDGTVGDVEVVRSLDSSFGL